MVVFSSIDGFIQFSNADDGFVTGSFMIPLSILGIELNIYEDSLSFFDDKYLLIAFSWRNTDRSSSLLLLNLNTQSIASI